MPVQVLPTRVWRNYAGGRLLDEAEGFDSPRDGRLPEDWIASTTLANNHRNDRPLDEGVSHYHTSCGEEGLLTELIPDGMGVLTKFLDPCERLQVQWHPDPAFALTHFGVERGKTELWIGFGERFDGAGHGWLGQRNNWTVDDWRRAIDSQDTAAMLDAMHRVHISPGDAWLVPAGIPHCIGGEGLYLEVQEPTDFAVRCEYRRDGVELPESQRWMGLNQELALQCLQAMPVDVETFRLRPRPKDEGAGWRRESLCGPEDCSCFSVDLIHVGGSAELSLTGPGVVVVLEGQATIAGLPAGVGSRFAILPEDKILLVDGQCRLLVCSGN